MSDYEPPMPIMKAVSASISQNTEQNMRTREDQAIANAIRTGYGNLGGLTHVVVKELQEAEARGAAEDRRKDAEGQEPIAWLVEQRGVDSPFFTQNKLAIESQFITGITPLYTRPANVAALEARVKELETRERKDQEVIHWLAEKLKQTDPAAKADYELLARAALTREGGV